MSQESPKDDEIQPQSDQGRNQHSSVLQVLWNWLKSGWRALSLLAVAVFFVGMNAATTTPSYNPTAAYASVSASKPSLLRPEVSLYKLQKVFAMNAVAKVSAVVVFAVPLVFLSAYVYKAVTGVPLKSAMFKTYSILQDTPGADACSEDSPAALLVTNITHVIGLFTYALVLGVVVDDVGGFVNEFKRGNTNLYESGHTVILNRNRHTGALLKQWATAQKESGKSGGAIVVMADVPKEELDVMVDEVRKETGLDVMGREGRPYDINDLNMVSASTAGTIIVMDPLQDLDSWDDKMVPPHAATLVSLAAVGAGPGSGQTLVVQSPNSPAGADVLASAARLHATPSSPSGGVVDVRGLEALAELQAQCALQPKLAAFHNQVFMPSAAGTEFYVRGFKALEGRTYGEARRAFKTASIVGFCNPGSQMGLVLNPPDQYIIQPGDEMVGLTQNANTFQPKSLPKSTTVSDAADSSAALEWAVPRKGVPEYCNKNIIVLCFDDPAPQVTQGLEDFLPRGSKVTYVSANGVENLPRGRFRTHQEIGSPASTQTLIKAGIEKADSIIITGVDNWESTNADIQVLSSIAQLSDICKDLPRSKPLHVVAQARGGDVDNFKDALESICPAGVDSPVVTTDILFTDDLVAGILTQSAMEPKLAPVITDILDAKGNRVTLRHPAHYTNPDETVTMAELEDRVRAQGDTVVGFYKADGSVVCAASKTARIPVKDVTHFIIISDTPKW